MRKAYHAGIILLINMVIATFLIQCSSTSKTSTENTATVTMVIGDVQLKKDNEWNALSQDTVLKQGQELKTGELSQCNLLLGDSSHILVKENSHLVLDALFKSAIGIEKSTVELKIGKSVINPKKLLKGEEFRVKTPTAIAAVRGTRFIVESNPEKKMRVSVVDGKVELQKRVPALEDADEETLERSEELASLKKQVESEKVILTANESAEIDNIKAEEVNEAVAAALEEFKKMSREEESVTGEKPGTVPLQKVDTGSMKVLVEKSESVKITLDEVKDSEKKEVEEHRQVIEKGDEIVEEKEEQTTRLSITTPVKGSAIMVNSRLLGYGRVTINPRPDVVLKIKVMARGFEEYTTELTLDDGEKKKLNIPMVKKKLLSRERWQKKVGSLVTGNMGYYRNMVFTGTQKGVLYAFNRNGKLLWQVNLGRKIESSPAFDGNDLYIVSHDEKLYAIDIRNGNIKWQKPLYGALLFGASPVIVNDTIFLVTAYGRVYSFNKKGKELWNRDLDAGVYSSPYVHGKKLYTGTDDRSLYCLDLDKGETLWKFDTDSRIVTSAPVVENNTVYVGAYSGTFYAVDAAEGKQKWAFKAGTSVMSTPVIYRGKVFMTSVEGILFALDETSGELKWKYATGNAISHSPAVANNLVYLAAGNRVYAVNAASGSLHWRHSLKSRVKTVPTVSGNDVFVGCENGKVISLRSSLKQVVD